VSSQIKESIHRTLLASIAGYYDQELEKVDLEEKMKMQKMDKQNLGEEPQSPLTPV
jgi:hypothetical protein